MFNANEDLDRRLRKIENAETLDYDVLSFKNEDNISNVKNEYKVSFYALKSSPVLVTVRFNLTENSNVQFRLNEVKTAPYKPVIGENKVKFKLFANAKTNVFKICFSNENFNGVEVEISGFVKDENDESSLEKAIFNEEDIICHYDDRKKAVTLYKFSNGVLTKFHEKKAVYSAAISSMQTELYLFVVNSSNELNYYKFASDLSVENAVLIDDNVTKVSGSVESQNSACYYIKDGVCHIAKIGKDGATKTNLGIKNACKISSTPLKQGVFVVTFYDKTSTLFTP